MKNIFALLIVFAAFSRGTTADAQVANGGSFTLEQLVITSGGGEHSAGGNFTLDGTIGQAVAGTCSMAATFNMQSGFWTTQPLVPTAATVSIGGRVTTADGRGIRNVLVTLTHADGIALTAITGNSGHYRFAEIEAGRMLTLNVQAKHFTLAQPTSVLSFADDADEINFVAVNQSNL